MSQLVTQLLEVYLRLASGILLGWILGRLLPGITARYLGQFLFWIGVPLSIVAFLRRADLSKAMWLAPLTSWLAIILGAGLAWLWLQWSLSQFHHPKVADRPFQGAFLLSAMVGNTSYLGYPIILSVLGEKYFGWALFYALLGTLLGAYGLGVFLAAYFGQKSSSIKQMTLSVALCPTLWALAFGLCFRQVNLSPGVDEVLKTIAWTVVWLSIILIGMRMSRLSSWKSLPLVGNSIVIKMILVPSLLGAVLVSFGLSGQPLLVMVLQTGMPPAFATVVIAEAYDLDRELAVTTVAVGSATLLVTLPLWLFLFGG